MLLTAWENEQALVEKKEKEVSGQGWGARKGGLLPPGRPAPRLRGAGSWAQRAFWLRLPPWGRQAAGTEQLPARPSEPDLGPAADTCLLKGFAGVQGPPHPQNTSAPVKERCLALVPLPCITS